MERMKLVDFSTLNTFNVGLRKYELSGVSAESFSFSYFDLESLKIINRIKYYHANLSKNDMIFYILYLLKYEMQIDSLDSIRLDGSYLQIIIDLKSDDYYTQISDIFKFKYKHKLKMDVVLEEDMFDKIKFVSIDTNLNQFKVLFDNKIDIKHIGYNRYSVSV